MNIMVLYWSILCFLVFKSSLFHQNNVRMGQRRMMSSNMSGCADRMSKGKMCPLRSGGNFMKGAEWLNRAGKTLKNSPIFIFWIIEYWGYFFTKLTLK